MESERACSRADMHSLLMIEVGNSWGSEVWGNSKGGSLAGKYTECAESESEDGLQKTSIVDLVLQRLAL